MLLPLVVSAALADDPAPEVPVALLLPSSGSSIAGYAGQTPVELRALTLELTGASALHALGYKGEGRTVLLIDTGLSPRSRAIGKLAAFKDFVGSCTLESPCDGNSHGTSMADLIHQIAPEAKLTVARVLNATGRYDNATILAALRWGLEIAEQQKIRVVSISLYGSATVGETAAMRALLKDYASRGIAVVVGVGNNGACSVRGMPAALPESFAVGASCHRFTPDCADDCPWPDNNAGPALVGTKPDILAPGEWVVAQIEQGTNYHSMLASLSRLESANSKEQIEAELATLALVTDWGIEKMREEYTPEKIRASVLGLPLRLLSADTALISGSSVSTALVSGTLALLDEACPGRSCAQKSAALKSAAKGPWIELALGKTSVRIGSLDASAAYRQLSTLEKK